MFAHSTVTKLIHLADQSVEEVAVVAHHYKSAVKVLQGLLQHVFGFEVEMVGWLVEDKEIDGFEQ